MNKLINFFKNLLSSSKSETLKEETRVIPASGEVASYTPAESNAVVANQLAELIKLGEIKEYKGLHNFIFEFSDDTIDLPCDLKKLVKTESLEFLGGLSRRLKYKTNGNELLEWIKSL